MIVHRGNSDKSIIQLSGNVSPGDGETRYFGSTGLVINGTGGLNKIYIARAGTITQVYILQLVTPTLGSTETSTISVRLNDSTNTTITSVFQQDQTSETFSNTGLSIAIAAGDFIEVIWVTPAWVTNPTVVYLGITLLLE